MIQVTVGTNTNRRRVNVDPNLTVKEVLEQNNVNYSATTIHLDGAPLNATEINSTFTDLGIDSDCYLLSIVKAENAYRFI